MAAMEELREKAQAAQHALWKAEAVERDKRNASMVGKCFKYRNSCGGDDRWWLYLKVMAVDEGNLRAFKFQQYTNGHIDIDPNDFVYHGRSLSEDGGYTEIEPSEFDREWAKLRGIIVAYVHSS